MAFKWVNQYELIGEKKVVQSEIDTKICVRECKSKISMGLRNRFAKIRNFKETTDPVLEDKEKKKIWVCEMACPQQVNIKAKRNEKHTKYRQLALELREKTLVVGALVGGIKDVLREVGRIFSEVPETETAITMTVVEMQETVLIGSDTII